MVEDRNGRRQPQQHLPRSSRGEERRPRPGIAAKVAAARPPTPLDYRRQGPGADTADRVVTGEIVGVEREFIWIEVEGARAKLYASELMLDIGEVPADRYAAGDPFEAFAFQMEPDPETGSPQFSIRRAALYVDALDSLEVGTVVAEATVINTYDLGLELDAGGVRGNALFWELPLAQDESPHDRYRPGEVIADLLVDQVDHQARALSFSIKRNAPDYVEALDAVSVGDLVSGTVTAFGGRGLWLEVGGVAGWVGPQELPLANGESAQEHYSVNETISDLFVRQVDRDAREISLSVRRSAPGYFEALDAHKVGDVVSATVTAFQDNGGLWLEVDGVVGGIAPRDLSLAHNESSHDRYAVDDPVRDLFAWQVNRDTRSISLSVRRNEPGYVNALEDVPVGKVVDGIVVEANERGVWLHVSDLIGWIPAQELEIDERRGLPAQYADGDSIKARVWQIDRVSRAVILSIRRLRADFVEPPVAPGAVIDAYVTETPPRGIRAPIRVLVAGADVRIPPHALSLSTAIPRRFHSGEVIPVRIVDLDEAELPAVVSHRRALDGWSDEVQRLAPDILVPQARLLPREVLPSNEPRVGVDLGPITGFIPEDELDQDTAAGLMMYSANETFPVVVESVDHHQGTAIVSYKRFEERWRELTSELSVGDEVNAELRTIEGGVAKLDLGRGLLAEMPADHLPTGETPVRAPDDRGGELFPVRIVSFVPEAYRVNAEIKNYDLAQMIAGGETLTCELKAAFARNKDGESGPEKEARQERNLSVVRAMAGMMNRNGGHVIVGVEDPSKKGGDVIGWATGGFPDQDTLSIGISGLVGRVLTPAAGDLYELRFETLPSGGPEILDIVCSPASEPIFLRDGNKDGEFPVRYTAMTKKLTAAEHEAHVRERFPRSRDDS